MAQTRRRNPDVRKRWARRRSKALSASRPDRLSRLRSPSGPPNLAWLMRRIRGLW
jgi:hypothetical protein